MELNDLDPTFTRHILPPIPYWHDSFKETSTIPNFCSKIVNLFKVDFLELWNLKDYLIDII